MNTFFRLPIGLTRPAAKRPPAPPAAVSAPHRQRFGVEVAYYHTAAEVAELRACPVAGSGRRVVLFAGQAEIPAGAACRVVFADRIDPYAAAVVAWSGAKDGDTLTVLLPADWDGPPAEALIDHARRYFASPHSSEDEARVG
jgi:hypothetical protein